MKNLQKRFSKIQDVHYALEQFSENLKKHTGASYHNMQEELFFGEPARQIENTYIKAKEVVFSTYFTKKLDPQRNIQTAKDQFQYIKPLYDSCCNNDLTLVIFHDALSQTFIDTHSNKHVHFIKCSLGPYSLNDERFIIYFQYIVQYGLTFEKILMCDVSDVTINKNPFELMRAHQHKILVGRADLNKFKHSYTNYLRIFRFEQDFGTKLNTNYFDMRIFNAGTIGGPRNQILFLLHQMTYVFNICQSSRNHNMNVLNYCLYSYWLEHKETKPVPYLSLRKLFLKIASHSKTKLKINILPHRYFCTNKTYNGQCILAGHPFTSRFKSFETMSDAYLTHK